MLIIMENDFLQKNLLAIMSYDDFEKILADIFAKNSEIIEDLDDFF